MKIADILDGSPGPRYKADGKNSAEEFREEYFIPWLEKHKETDFFLSKIACLLL